MSIDQQWELLIIPEFALAFILPTALYALGQRWIRHRFIRLALVVGLVWVARYQFRMNVSLPIREDHALLHGDLDYDGVGGNAAVFLLGWFEPLLTCLVIIALTAIVRRLRRPPSKGPHATTRSA